jgi:5,10-methylenetetrahydrofolate reductase
LLPVCHVALLQLPVIAGVMPIQSLSSFKLIVESSHAAVPDDVRHTRSE